MTAEGFYTKEKKRRRNTINVRLDDAAHNDISRGASEAGRSLSGEIQFKLQHYQFMLEIRDKFMKK